MSRCTLVILTNPTEGREDEFGAWYDAHLDHMLELDDCVSAQLFRFVPASDKPPEHRYLALYEFETDDVPATQERLHARMGTETMPESDAKATTVGWYFEPVTERRTAEVTS